MAAVRYLPANQAWALVTEGLAIVAVRVGGCEYRSLFGARVELVGALRRNGLQVDDKGAVSATSPGGACVARIYNGAEQGGL